jgi:peptidoglycan hydrolase CwlO-like protein
LFEKTKQGDDLDRQLQVINNEYEDLKLKFDELQEEKKKLNNEINLLMNKIQNFEIDKSQSIQVKFPF